MTVDPQPRRYHGKASDGQPVTALVMERIQTGQRDGRTVINRTPVATADQPGDNIQVGNGVRLKNPRDGTWVAATAIDGKFKADVPCDSRCTNAKGNNCECSCGGVNHGSAWGS